MLVGFTFVVIAIVTFAAVREGLLTACTSLVNVFLAGLVACNFFEPLAEQLEGMLTGSVVNGCEDAFTLFALFAGTLGILRVITNNIAPSDPEIPARLQQVASGAVALVTGYLLAGFLVVFLQTLPWEQKFLDFDSGVDTSGTKIRQMLPPDRVWLAIMHRAGLGPLSQADSVTFDPEGSFEQRYLRLRRYKDTP